MDQYTPPPKGRNHAVFDLMDTAKCIFEEQRSRLRFPSRDRIGYFDSCELMSHFGSCGRICNLVIPKDPITNVVDRSAEEKALAFDGSEMGKWNVIVKVLPHEDLEFTTDQLAFMSIAHFKKTRSQGISVKGYNTSLPSNDGKSALSKHFSSCGEITDVFVLNSGSNMGGCELVVKALPVPKRNPGPLSLPFGYTVPAECVEAAHKIHMAQKMTGKVEEKYQKKLDRT